MSNTIQSRTISSVVDKRARLSNSNFARAWSTDLGTNWTTIRLGGRISMDDTGAGFGSTPRLAIGVCSGTSNIFMDATTTHWAGALTNNANWNNATANSQTGFYVMGHNWPFGVTAPFCASKRVGSTLTVGTILNASTGVIFANTLKTTVFMLDITKGSPNFTFTLLFCSDTGASHVTSDTFLTQMPLSSPSFGSHTQSSGITLAVDEATDGYFNAVNISWDRTSPAIEISDLAVAKIA